MSTDKNIHIENMESRRYIVITAKNIRLDSSKRDIGLHYANIVRKDCGGFPVSYAMDCVLKAKARLRGWKTRRFEESVATQMKLVHLLAGFINHKDGSIEAAKF